MDLIKQVIIVEDARRILQAPALIIPDFSDLPATLTLLHHHLYSVLRLVAQICKKLYVENVTALFNPSNSP